MLNKFKLTLTILFFISIAIICLKEISFNLRHFGEKNSGVGVVFRYSKKEQLISKYNSNGYLYSSQIKSNDGKIFIDQNYSTKPTANIGDSVTFRYLNNNNTVRILSINKSKKYSYFSFIDLLYILYFLVFTIGVFYYFRNFRDEIVMKYEKWKYFRNRGY